MGLYPSSFLPAYPRAFSLTRSSSVSQQMAALPGSGPFLGGAEAGVCGWRGPLVCLT